MSTSAPSLSEGDAELEAALGLQRKAIVAREAEHDRQARQRLLFGRVTLLSVLVLVLALWVTARAFDPQVFTERLREKAGAGTSSILTSLKNSAAELTPVYKAEVERTFPAFSEGLSKTTAAESETLAKTMLPLASSDPGRLTKEADDQLADMLLAAFPAELAGDRGKSRILASALRAQEIAATHSALTEELSGPFKALGEIQEALKGMGPPDMTVIEPSEVVDAVGTAALDIIKAKIEAGETLGIGNDAKHAKATSLKALASKGGE